MMMTANFSIIDQFSLLNFSSIDENTCPGGWIPDNIKL